MRVLHSQGRWATAALLVAAAAMGPAIAQTQFPNNPKTVRVMITGLGSGTVSTSNGQIECTPDGIGCSAEYLLPFPVVLDATADPGSVFVGWRGSCAGTIGPSCQLWTDNHRSVRAEFQLLNGIAPLDPVDINPAGIGNYLMTNSNVNNAARFLRALPTEYRQGWILMTRSESLQTGTARFPRVMLPSANALNVFTLGLASHASYPGSHPNAIEYMQWDGAQKNFRFHEIVLDSIPAVTATRPNGTVYETFPARTRGVSVDEPRCTRCHSTRNVPNPNPAHQGTTGSPPGLVLAKNKPNWDSYDSWGGAMPFNRDRIYKGSLEAAAFRQLFNWWTWAENAPVRQIMEQLSLQPDVPTMPAQERITRYEGGSWDGLVQFPFDGGLPVFSEPAPLGQVNGTNPAIVSPNYSFNNLPGSGTGSAVQRHGPYVTLQAYGTTDFDEGRAVQLFDLLGGLDGPTKPNQVRVGHELANHRFATGSLPMDVRPVALAINMPGCLQVDSAANRLVSGVSTATLTFDQNFFRERNNGLGINEIIADTLARSKDLPRRKADIQKLNLDRDGDAYLVGSSPTKPEIDLLSEYGANTSAGTAPILPRLRQEVFRRPNDRGVPDDSIMGGGLYVDREIRFGNSQLIGLYRFLLEPLGVAIDKWSMGVRGRSRSYAFADVLGTYGPHIRNEIVASLASRPYAGSVQFNPNDCGSLIAATNEVLGALPAINAVPPFTDVQRVFNKGCIECHGGLNYPPFSKFPIDLDLSEEENPASANRLLRAHAHALAFTSNTLASSRIWSRITSTSELCPFGMMPCGGPALSQADVHTIKRWIQGGRPGSWGDPHLTTMNGTAYDFQSAGEFTLLRGEAFELQARHTPVQADAPLPPDGHSGLTSCPSISTAAALRVGPHRVTYQPDPNGRASPEGLQLRVDGKLVEKLGTGGYTLSGGGRILATTGGGIQVQYPGGTEVVITPGWWDYYQLWYLNIDVRQSRALFGLMGQIHPGEWLPALPDGSMLGGRPAGLSDRYQQIYGQFADAWRVRKSSSLFDYAPGTSTGTFTLKDWPLHQPKRCELPPGWAPPLPPQKRISADEAAQFCRVLVDKKLRAHCATDVMVTGEPGFVKAYLETERLQRNQLPRAPSLVAPAADALDLPDALGFTWETSSDADGDSLTYLHCLWPVGETQTFDHCKPVRDNSTAVAGLEAGKAYYWKLVVDDGQGGTIESEMRRFMTR